MKHTVQELTDQCGPAYFGRMGASISHEIKNCLAIINENAIEDLASGAVLNISTREYEENRICLSFQCEQPFASDFGQASSRTLDLFQVKIVLNDQHTKADLILGR